jgi:TonB family protein
MARVITKEEKQAFIGTVLFHLILLFLFLFFGLTHLVPEPKTGMNLTFGAPESGSGDVQPVSNETPTPTPPEPTAAVTPVSEVSDDVLTTTETTVKVTATPEEIEREKKASEEAEKLKKENEIKRLKELAEIKKKEDFKTQINEAFKNTSNDATSNGNNGGKGDEGHPDGNENPGANIPGTNGPAIGPGGSGRTWDEVKPVGVQNEEGKVEVLVFVDSDGNVTKASIHTSTNSSLNTNALAAAKKWKFSPHPELGSGKQKIIIPFVFTF